MPNLLPSGRELQVIELTSLDLTQKEIGNVLCISLKTVNAHAHNLHQKLGVHSATAAYRKCLERGLIEMPEREAA